jgi:salicylate hydroxylase
VSRTILIAGAGIAGLTAALALADRGFRVIVAEKTDRLTDIGAGLQLSPNATRILFSLGLEAPLTASAITPEAIGVMSARTGQAIVRIPLGSEATQRYGSPYLVLHRADLQKALLDRVRQIPDIDLRLGLHVQDAAVNPHGVAIALQRDGQHMEETAIALIGADGVWSSVRNRLFSDAVPQFSGKIAWRGTLEAARLPYAVGPQRMQLWLGAQAHLVIYPLRGGRLVNIVAIADGEWNKPGWSEPAQPGEVARYFTAGEWPVIARAMIDNVTNWTRWALFSAPDLDAWTKGPIALIGDAAHAMLPFAAQGAGMAIEDAAVLAKCLADAPGEVGASLHRYEALRRPRVTRVQQTARQLGQIYQLHGVAALARDVAMKTMGGARIRSRQDWIYDWRLS